MTPLAYALIDILVKASAIMAVAAAFTLISRRASAARRHMIWAIAILALTALPLFTTVLPTWTLAILPAPIAAADPVEATAPELPLTRKISRSLPASAAPAAVSPQSAPLPWSSIALGVYLTGVALLLIHLVVERLLVARLSRHASAVTDPEWTALMTECCHISGIRGGVRLLRSLDRTMPMAFGVWRPAIVIPSIADTWTGDRRRAVLLHELAHIARRDCLTQLIARIVCACYWPHPGSWLIARRLRVERELACDDRVLAIGTAAPDYAQHLLELAYSLGGYRAPALVVSMARPKQLEGRMLAVLDRARNRTTPSASHRIACAVAAAVLVLPLAAVRPTAKAVVTVPSMLVGANGASIDPETPASAPASAPAPEQSSGAKQKTRREIEFPGTWQLRQTDSSKVLQLQLSERRNSISGFDVTLDQLQGLSASSLSGNGGPVSFSLRRDAGTLTFDGAFRRGVGAGTFEFTPNASFISELTKRGYERPNDTELYVMARNDIGTRYLDELSSQKYARPTLDQLLRAGDHGVDLDYLRDMGGAGYHLGQIESLIRTRDHGVDLEFVNGLKSHGLSNLTVDELVRARDHGVDPDYIGGMKHAGYDLRDLESLIRARDHGVDPDFVESMQRHGHKGDLQTMVYARDHGVDEDFVQSFSEIGYKDLTIQELVRLRDHGVNASWAKRQNSGRSRMSIDELVRRRDRGGDR